MKNLHYFGKTKMNNSNTYEENVLVAYRDNTLFQSIVPEVVNTLSTNGYHVFEQRFPQGTSEEDITTWIYDSEILAYDKICCDGTFRNVAARAFEKQGVKVWDTYDTLEQKALFSGSSRGGDELLDDFSHRIAQRAILGKEMSIGYRRKETFEQEAEKEKNLYNLLLNSISEKPKRVFISQSKLIDHEPFSIMIDGDGNEVGRYASKLLGESPTEYQTYRDEHEGVAAQMLAEWFKEAGIPEVKIVKKECSTGKWLTIPEKVLLDPQIDREYKTPENGDWLVSDRHVESCYPEDLEERGLIAFRVPFQSFWFDAWNNNLISVDEEAFKQTISEELHSMLK